MKFKAIIFLIPIIISAAACSSSAPEMANQSAIVNVNSQAVQTNNNPIANVNASSGGGSTTTNSRIPGIPDMPGTEKPINGKDMTRDVKISVPTRPAPDNSEISDSLAENMVSTRTFKNNPQIAKIEVITLLAQNNKKQIKVYLRNGQVRELPEGKVDPLNDTAANIMKALAGEAPAKPDAKAETQKKP